MWVKELEGGAVLEEGENSVGDLINGEMFADVSLGGFPHEGAFGGVEFDQQGPVTLGGSAGGLIRDRFV